jgi:hypothetical protein
MVSQIDPSLPITGRPQTDSVRRNFSHARDEISAIQAGGPFRNVATDMLSIVPPLDALTTGYGLWGDVQFLHIGVTQGRNPIVMLAANEDGNSIWVQGVLGCEAAIPSLAFITTRFGDPYVGLWNDGSGLQIGTTTEWGLPDRAVISITKDGASFLLPVQLPADPIADLEAATKQYVDAAIDALRAELLPR